MPIPKTQGRTGPSSCLSGSGTETAVMREAQSFL